MAVSHIRANTYNFPNVYVYLGKVREQVAHYFSILKELQLPIYVYCIPLLATMIGVSPPERFGKLSSRSG